MSSEAPDIAYICRAGDDNEELRHSLRSLVNLPHGRVFLFGDAPSWVRNVEIRRFPLLRDKQLTAVRNLREACSDPELSDPFIVFNDDFYVMHPMNELPVLHLGDMPSVIASHALGSAYRNAMVKTYDRMLELGTIDPMSYELHIPMLIEKVGMLLALSLGQGIHGMHNRTMYGNLMGIGGERSEDVKVYNADKVKRYEEMPLLSTSDRTFRYHRVGHYIRKHLSEPSIYEALPRARKHEAHRYSNITFAR